MWTGPSARPVHSCVGQLSEAKLGGGPVRGPRRRPAVPSSGFDNRASRAQPLAGDRGRDPDRAGPGPNPPPVPAGTPPAGGTDPIRARRLLDLADRATQRGRWARTERWGRTVYRWLEAGSLAPEADRPAGGESERADLRRRAAMAVGRARLAQSDPAGATRWMHQAWGTAHAGARSPEDRELLLWLGWAAVATGDFELARMRFEAALPEDGAEEPPGAPAVRARCYRAWVVGLHTGQHLLAPPPASEDPEEFVRQTALAAVVEARAGEISQAERRLTEATLELRDVPRPDLAVWLEVARVAVDREQAQVHASRGDRERADQAWTRAAQRLARVRVRPWTGWVGVEIRVMERVVEQGPRNRFAEPPAHRPCFQVQQDGAWFRVADGEPVDCRRRPVLRRLLAELAARRLREPGRPAPAAELFAAGWPDQRICTVSAKNRLKVAISTLRKMGFGAFLIGDREGYRLDPHCPLELVEGSELDR